MTSPPAARRLADVGTPEGWLGWLAEHREQVAVVLDDGRGGAVDHRSGEPQPLASPAKLVHLAGYAAAVRDGLVRPDQPVRVADEAGGWPDAPVVAFPGPFLRLLDPALTDEEAAARRYREDPAEAARLPALPLPDLAEQAAWAATTASASAEGLAVLHASPNAGDPPLAREHLEWQPGSSGALG